MSHFNDNIKLYSDCRLPNFFPFEKFLIGDTFDTKFLRINMADIYRKLINEEADQHMKNEAGDRPEDFLSIYLSAIEGQEENDRKKKQEVEKEGGKKKGKTEEKASTINRECLQKYMKQLLVYSIGHSDRYYCWFCHHFCIIKQLAFSDAYKT